MTTTATARANALFAATVASIASFAFVITLMNPATLTAIGAVA